MYFAKLHGAGKDYIFLDDPEETLDLPQLAKRMSDRHFGVGGDGLVVIQTSRECH